MMSCPVSRYLRAHCDRHALSYLSRLAPGLETHLSKHTSASFATTCGWIKLGSGSAERRWVPGFGKSKSQRRPGEIEGGEGRHTSLNIALRFSSSRNVAICGSMPCWGPISNCNPGDMRSEWSLEEGRCQKRGGTLPKASDGSQRTPAEEPTNVGCKTYVSHDCLPIQKRQL